MARPALRRDGAQRRQRHRLLQPPDQPRDRALGRGGNGNRRSAFRYRHPPVAGHAPGDARSRGGRRRLRRRPDGEPPAGSGRPNSSASRRRSPSRRARSRTSRRSRATAAAARRSSSAWRRTATATRRAGLGARLRSSRRRCRTGRTARSARGSRGRDQARRSALRAHAPAGPREHDTGGGTSWSRGLSGQGGSPARTRLATHLDGARMFNAAAAARPTVKDLAAGFDSVSVCLSKGLGAPAGTVLARQQILIAKSAPGAQDSRRRHAPGRASSPPRASSPREQRRAPRARPRQRGAAGARAASSSGSKCSTTPTWSWCAFRPTRRSRSPTSAKRQVLVLPRAADAPGHAPRRRCCRHRSGLDRLPQLLQVGGVSSKARRRREIALCLLQFLLRDGVFAQAFDQAVGGVVVGVEQGGAGGAGADQRGGGASSSSNPSRALNSLLFASAMMPPPRKRRLDHALARQQLGQTLVSADRVEKTE